MKDQGRVNNFLSQVKLNSKDGFDKDIYNTDKEKYNTYIKDDKDLELDEEADMRRSYKKTTKYSVPQMHKKYGQSLASAY